MHWFVAVPSKDWFYTGLLVFGLFILVFFAELVSRKRIVPGWQLRKAVHVFTGVFVLAALFLLQDVVPLTLIAAGFAAFNLWSILRNAFRSFNATPNRSLGTFYYPLSFLILLAFFWPEHKLAVLISFSLMAFADAAAGIAGRNAPKSEMLNLPGDTKSLRGSATMFVTSSIITATWLMAFADTSTLNNLQLVLTALMVGLLATSAEAVSIRGSDNLSVPILSALLIYAFDNPDLQIQFGIAMLLAGAVVAMSYRLHLLDLSGALAGFLVGTVTFGAGGWPYTIPMLLFFGVSNVLSKILKSERKDRDKILEKGSHRDAKQVLANGLLPALLVLGSLLEESQYLYIFYLSGLAAAMADTWATEIGMAFSSRPRSIITGRLVPVGESGGVTFSGTSGAVLAAAFMAGCGVLIGKFWPIYSLSSIVFVIIAISAILAQVLDSLLGATVQRKNRCTVCHKLTERQIHCDTTTAHIKGLMWMDNDVVNILCSLSGIFFSYIMVKYLLN